MAIVAAKAENTFWVKTGVLGSKNGRLKRVKTNHQCWEWIPEKFEYSIQLLSGKTLHHRKPPEVALLISQGRTLRPQESIHHLCENKRCCNPEHLCIKEDRTDADRFWEKVDKTPGFGPDGDCWRWAGWITNYGYGQFYLSRKLAVGSERVKRAHVYSWELANGPVPEGMCICHRCDIRTCVNPAHLWMGSKTENNQDRHKKGRTKNGVSKGSANGSAKLTEEDVKYIRTLEGVQSQREIARHYGVSGVLIGKIIRKELWTHI